MHVPGDGAAGQPSYSSSCSSLSRRARAIRAIITIGTIALAWTSAIAWPGGAHAVRLAGLWPGSALLAAAAAQPPVDTDSDGMPDEWEAFFGLNPNDPGDATADPDGDGLTNLQEFQQGGHPSGTQTRYFAEGALGFFRTDIGLVNPSTTDTAKVLLTYLTETGTRFSQRVELAPMQRRTVSVNDFLSSVASGVGGGISTIVESNVPIAADRFMQWGASLNVVQNLVSTDPTSVPPAIQALAGNSRYFLFFISNWQPSYNIPTGALYQFLLAIGAGPGLISGEQMIEQLGTGYITHFSYVLAASLSANNVPGFEVFSEVHFEVLTMQFMPVTVDGQTTYAPVSIGGLQP